MELDVNPERRRIEVDPEMPLLRVLREVPGLTGTTYGCGIAECGACTVLLDGEEIRSCVRPVGDTEGKRITTTEDLGNGPLHGLREAWIEDGVPRCGSRRSGQLPGPRRPPPASSDDISDHMSGILRRCGASQRLLRVIHRAAAELGEASS